MNNEISPATPPADQASQVRGRGGARQTVRAALLPRAGAAHAFDDGPPRRCLDWQLRSCDGAGRPFGRMKPGLLPPGQGRPILGCG